MPSAILNTPAYSHKSAWRRRFISDNQQPINLSVIATRLKNKCSMFPSWWWYGGPPWLRAGPGNRRSSVNKRTLSATLQIHRIYTYICVYFFAFLRLSTYKLRLNKENRVISPISHLRASKEPFTFICTSIILVLLQSTSVYSKPAKHRVTQWWRDLQSRRLQATTRSKLQATTMIATPG